MKKIYRTKFEIIENKNKNKDQSSPACYYWVKSVDNTDYFFTQSDLVKAEALGKAYNNCLPEYHIQDNPEIMQKMLIAVNKEYEELLWDGDKKEQRIAFLEKWIFAYQSALLFAVSLGLMSLVVFILRNI